MICSVEIASDLSAFQAARVGDHAKHGLLLEGRDGSRLTQEFHRVRFTTCRLACQQAATKSRPSPYFAGLHHHSTAHRCSCWPCSDGLETHRSPTSLNLLAPAKRPVSFSDHATSSRTGQPSSRYGSKLF